MNLLADENISHRIVERLRLDGHIVTLAQDVAHGKQDSEVLAIAHARNEIVLTEDTDFGDLAMRQRLPSAGVILLRLSGMARPLQPGYVARTLALHTSAIPNSFTVITPASVRTRPLP